MNHFVMRWVLPVLVVLVLADQSFFTVAPQQAAVVTQFGRVAAFHTTPGIYFKVPFVQQARRLDTNLQILGGAASNPFLTSDRKSVQPEWYIHWRIADIPRFYAQLQDVPVAQMRLQQLVQAAMRDAFANHSLAEISGNRVQIANPVTRQVAANANALGLQVVDVGINRLELSPDTADVIYQRMQADLQKQAEQVRVQGMAAATHIRTDANKQRDAILSNAQRDAARIKGEGEAQAAAILAKAAAQDPDFYSFYKSLETYKQTFKDKRSILVIGTDSAFFRYFRAPGTSR